MQNIKNQRFGRQLGITFISLIFMLVIVGMIAMIGIKISPTVIEFMSIKKAIQSAKQSGATVREIQIAFDKQAEIGYFDAVAGKDLSIVKTSDGSMDVSFAYTKKIPLFGPASLLLEYEGTTAKNGTVPKKQE
ncbi:DUF4845 domain-containing protein [Undibacterium sp. RTI2.1]|uniref:DUF4845 domain-containing protein n=1 Tax=unclassified Undibacterium TaxID=2630295 RepID=UPI002AB466AE|nr:MULTISPECIES: DUF4845 domain-containing protein [unclassified Undibacterium]MDY7537511.1 DUF4845 domain-containing protein [Undibacterium sp. 5I1]MEB0032989.1 DUF4845 domain-containing protein [Undibacterium sp. RTI2.1]MEB0117813.1 DUF4845 domain-containing protein [Undibacterium sp. RTI2.2]MEB0230908.1 DUF4845 domain-containing protein [Undibacterium sp. 10I3]MEB0258253.1 DUF4845 domain-containing protein [Undibacterium sp. 5I1]